MGALYRATRRSDRDEDLWRLGAVEGAAGQIRFYRRPRLCCGQAAVGAEGVADMANPLTTLQEYGQSVWLDFVSRDLLKSGGVAQMITQNGVRGGTFKPILFQKKS